MSNPEFVVAAYAIVLGGLAGYVVSIARRVRAARRTTDMLVRERERTLPDEAGESAATTTGQPSEVH